jgi:LPXTG-motif cell wall-anchored protein
MKRPSNFGAALAGLAFAALASVALAQQTPPGHGGPAPSNTPAHPEWGATDPTRSGTMTRGTENMNNNRLPGNPPAQDTSTTTSAVETTTAPEVAAPVAPAPVDTYTPRQVTTDTSTPAPPPQLPRTGSSMPLAATAGLLSLGAVLAIRARR